MMDTTKFTHRLTKVLVDIMFYGGILVCILLPFWITRQSGLYVEYEGSVANVVHIAILLPAAICAVYILFQLKMIFKTLMRGNPFVLENVSCLRKCGVTSFLMAIIFILRLVFWFTPGSVVLIIICVLLGLFCLTLKDVFKQAISYKEENDWTV